MVLSISVQKNRTVDDTTPMTQEELEQYFRYGDTSPEAISHRLILARLSTGKLQKDIASEIGISKQTLHSQEAAGSGNVKTGRYYLRRHGIDFNFLFYGDASRLSSETVSRLVSPPKPGADQSDRTPS